MTSTVHFPSIDFPALPQIRAELPDLWTRVQPPGAIIAAVRATAPGTFTPNVVISVTRFGPEHVLQATIDTLRAKVATYPEYAWGDESTDATSTVASYTADVSYVDLQAGTVLQSHRVLLVDHGPAKDLVHAVAMCAAEQMDAVVPEMRSVLHSVTVAV